MSLQEVCATLHLFRKKEGAQRRSGSHHNKLLRKLKSAKPEDVECATILVTIVGPVRSGTHDCMLRCLYYIVHIDQRFFIQDWVFLAINTEKYSEMRMVRDK